MKAQEHYTKACEQMKSKAYTLAIESFDAAIVLAPGVAEYYQGRAEAFLKLKKWRQAVADYTKVTELAKQIDLKVYQDRAEAYAHLGKVDLAISDLRKVLEQDRGNVELLAKLASYYVMNNDKVNAIIYYNQALNLCPEPTFYIARATAHLTFGEHQLAEDDFAKAAPGLDDYYNDYNRAFVYLSRNNRSSMADYYFRQSYEAAHKAKHHRAVLASAVQLRKLNKQVEFKDYLRNPQNMSDIFGRVVLMLAHIAAGEELEQAKKIGLDLLNEEHAVQIPAFLRSDFYDGYFSLYYDAITKTLRLPAIENLSQHMPALCDFLRRNEVKVLHARNCNLGGSEALALLGVHSLTTIDLQANHITPAVARQMRVTRRYELDLANQTRPAEWEKLPTNSAWESYRKDLQELKLDKIIKDITAILAQNPWDQKAHLYRAWAYYLQGKTGPACEDLDLGFETERNRSLLMRAVICRDLGDVQGARQYFFAFCTCFNGITDVAYGAAIAYGAALLQNWDLFHHSLRLLREKAKEGRLNHNERFGVIMGEFILGNYRGVENNFVVPIWPSQIDEICLKDYYELLISDKCRIPLAAFVAAKNPDMKKEFLLNINLIPNSALRARLLFHSLTGDSFLHRLFSMKTGILESFLQNNTLNEAMKNLDELLKNNQDLQLDISTLKMVLADNALMVQLKKSKERVFQFLVKNVELQMQVCVFIKDEKQYKEWAELLTKFVPEKKDFCEHYYEEQKEVPRPTQEEITWAAMQSFFGQANQPADLGQQPPTASGQQPPTAAPVASNSTLSK